GALSGVAVPALNGLLANNVRDNQQGEMQGAVNATNSLTAIIAPVAATQLFSYFTSPAAPMDFPGAPFFAAGLCVILAALLFIYAALSSNMRPGLGAKPTPRMAPPVGQAVNPPDTEPLNGNDNGS